MNCPYCKEKLRKLSFHEVIVDTCGQCGGMWFDASELHDFVEYLRTNEEDSPEIERDPDADPIVTQVVWGEEKLCPRCHTSLEGFNYAYDSGIILDKCPSCRGIWTDGGELKRVVVYSAGDSDMHELGEALLDENKQLRRLHDMAHMSKELSSRVSPIWLYMPKIILPLRDNISSITFPWVVVSIILLNLVIAACEFFLVDNLCRFIAIYGLTPAALWEGYGYHGFITHMFLHAGYFHVLGNMFFLWIFGDNVEDYMGHLHFTVFYLLCGLFAAAAHVVSNPCTTMPCVGASGAIAGILGAYFYLYPYAKIKTLVICRVIDVPAWFLLGGWLAMQLLMVAMYTAAGLVAAVAFWAHIGGFVFGLLGMIAYRKMRLSGLLRQH